MTAADTGVHGAVFRLQRHVNGAVPEEKKRYVEYRAAFTRVTAEGRNGAERWERVRASVTALGSTECLGQSASLPREVLRAAEEMARPTAWARSPSSCRRPPCPVLCHAGKRGLRPFGSGSGLNTQDSSMSAGHQHTWKIVFCPASSVRPWPSLSTSPSGGSTSRGTFAGTTRQHLAQPQWGRERHTGVSLEVSPCASGYRGPSVCPRSGR